MSYQGDAGEISASYRRTSYVKPLIRPTSSVQFIAPGSVTGGEFGLFRWEMRARSGGPQPHFHRGFSESFYILDGVIRLWDGARSVNATAGDFLFVPQGGIHAFRNDSDADAAMLILFSPGAPRERFFTEIAEIGDSGRELTRDEWAAFYAKHDQFMV
jgi:mannose-6-phosphate isomerase-like protein (cupin superfamily)